MSRIRRELAEKRLRMKIAREVQCGHNEAQRLLRHAIALQIRSPKRSLLSLAKTFYAEEQLLE